MKKYLLIILYLVLISQVNCSSNRYIKEEGAEELVVLIHGIRDKPYIMWKLEQGLSKSGYSIMNLHYPSVKADMDSIVSLVHSRLAPRLQDYQKINFVTHSLGGIVMRAYLHKHKQSNFQRLVMIAPPNKGAIMAERFEDFFIYKWIYGQTGQKLGKDSTDYWQQIPPPSIDFGIIAGGLGNDKGFNPLIPGDDDGTVGVAETKIAGAQDFIVIPGLHTSLLWQNRTLEQVLYFLEYNHFKNQEDN